MNTDTNSQRGVEHAHIIDIVAHDEKEGSVTLIMLEPRPWDGSELRLFQLQEKINAYLSFALDGEMAEAYPNLISLPLRLQLDCATPPGLNDRELPQPRPRTDRFSGHRSPSPRHGCRRLRAAMWLPSSHR